MLTVSELWKYTKHTDDKTLIEKDPFLSIMINSLPNSTCSTCGGTLPCITAGGKPYCLECASAFDVCSDCHSVYTDKHEAHELIRGFCPNCTEKRVFVCSDCGKWHVKTEENRFTYKGNAISVCNSCRESYRHCDDCSNLHKHTDVIACPSCDAVICPSCYESRHGETCIRKYDSLVRGYHSLPQLIFHKKSDTTAFYGLELELELEDINTEFKRAMIAYFKNHSDKMWMSKDSSISRGYEYITHPIALDILTEESGFLSEFSTVVAPFIARNRSKQGLHIHTNKDNLTRDIVSNIDALLSFNRNFFVLFAGRTQDHYAQFRRINESSKLVLSNFSSNNNGRYSALNREPNNTLELRIFEGRHDFKYISACVELYDCMIHFLKNYSTSSMTFSKQFQTFYDILTNEERYRHARDRCVSLQL